MPLDVGEIEGRVDEMADLFQTVGSETENARLATSKCRSYPD